MIRRVGSIPGELAHVRKQLADNTEKQRYTAEGVSEVQHKLKIADKHIGDVYELVGDVRKKTLQTTGVTEQNYCLSNALLEEQKKHQQTKKLVEDYKNRLQEMSEELQTKQLQIDRLQEQVNELTLQKLTLETNMKFKTKQPGKQEPEMAYSAILEAAHGAEWFLKLTNRDQP